MRTNHDEGNRAQDEGRVGDRRMGHRDHQAGAREAVKETAQQAPAGARPQNPARRGAMLEIFEDRYADASTLITSQLPVTNWHEIIGEPTFADAIDGLTPVECETSS